MIGGTMGHKHEHDNKAAIAGIAAASAVIGALTAMMFTPRTGEQLRHGLGRKARNAKDTAVDKVHRAREDEDSEK